MASIGVLDSGVGGLSVLREIHRQLPLIDTLYFADQLHVPYGPRPHSEIDAFVDVIVRYFLAQDVDAVVLACHAASAASLKPLRQRYPQVPFVGIEPAVKPAAEATQSGAIGVLTTQATADGRLYQRVVRRFTQHVTVYTHVVPELVAMVEAGDFSHERVRSVATQLPLDEIDQLVLACTHFPFLADVIQEVVGQTITLVDPGPAVARQVARILPGHAGNGARRYITSGKLTDFQVQIERLIGATEVAETAGAIFAHE